MKVSFDFDGTLSEIEVQNFATSLLERGFDVFVVTSRINTENAMAKGWHWIKRQNEELYEVSDRCGISRDNIIFTEMVDKIEYLEGKDFIFHLDDSDEEIELISGSEDECEAVDVKIGSWKEECEKILLNYQQK